MDLRFGLKERVSSALNLSPLERETDVGKALLRDAQHRVKRIDVREHFRPDWNGIQYSQLLRPSFVLVALLAKDATREQASASLNDPAEGRQRIRRFVQELKRKLAERKKQAEAAGLENSDALITKLQRAVDELGDERIDRKKALVKLNNLTKELADRQATSDGSRRTRDQLKQLKSMQPGPADKISNALKDGNMQQALDELRKLSEKVRSDELTQKEREELVRQLRQLQNEIEKSLGAKRALAENRRELEEKINQLRKDGKLAEAGQFAAQSGQCPETTRYARSAESPTKTSGRVGRQTGPERSSRCKKVTVRLQPINSITWPRI